MSSRSRESAASMAGKNGYSLISREKFRQLFGALIASRLLNEELCAAGEPAAGFDREAGPAGLVLDLRGEDTVLLPSPSHFAHRLRNGHAPAAPEANGSATLSWRLTQAVAVALNNKLEKNNAVVLVLFDVEASTGLTAYDEVFAIAVANKLPILFVLESHDGFADSAAFQERHAMLPYIAVDAHDMVAVYRVAQESIVRTREGTGPALIELASYRPEDPVEKMHRYLAAKGLPATEWRADLKARA